MKQKDTFNQVKRWMLEVDPDTNAANAHAVEMIDEAFGVRDRTDGVILSRGKRAIFMTINTKKGVSVISFSFENKTVHRSDYANEDVATLSTEEGKKYLFKILEAALLSNNWQNMGIRATVSSC